jgi:hypothetical protein
VVDLSAEWIDAMRHGDFAAAWRVSDRVLARRRPGEQAWHLPRHEQWIWDGRPLEGRRVLVRCYHGLGDTIQFARFLPRLERIASETTVWVQPELVSLLAALPGRRALLELHDGSPDLDYEADLEIMELGHVLRIRPESLVNDVPYFDVPRRAAPSDRFNVGLVAEAGEWDPQRRLPVDLLQPLMTIPSVRLFNLQLVSPLPGLADLSTPDILELASRLTSLDLVIAPDTMVAHLAGSLGVPIWVLLRAEADWRWMAPPRVDSPWYPTMRLFRQHEEGDWHPVLDEVATALRAIAQSSLSLCPRAITSKTKGAPCRFKTAHT